MRKIKLFKIFVPLIFWILVWEILAVKINKPLLLPTPLSVLLRLRELIVMPLFWKSAAMSLLRIFTGLILGTLAGTVCALMTHCFRLADWILSPVIRLIRATPVASFIILVLLWVAKGRVPGVISALMVLPIIWENLTAGLQAADSKLLEMARAYRLGRGRTIRYIYRPALRPYFRTGLANAVGFAWKAGVAAEVLCLPAAAIGREIYYSKIYLETSSLFAWTAMVIVLSLVLEKVFKRVCR